ncbi:MAG: alpha/beta hydrolase [Cyanobacteria bacterium SBLK]|nr:alpha/beta hydrolase [Cyanobacteria bacterium SBLK]
MPIYGPDPIVIEGISGDRYWYDNPFSFTGIEEIDDRLSGFPVAVFAPRDRHPRESPLVIGIQGMCAPYNWNAFLVPTLTQMGMTVALFDTPLAGERSLARTFTADFCDETQPLLQENITFDTELLMQIFSCVARDIRLVRDLCRDRYNLNDSRLALFGVSMGVLQSAFAFTADGIGDRLLGVIGHANLQTFAQSWSMPGMPELASSVIGKIAEKVLATFRPDIQPIVPVLRLVKDLKRETERSAKYNPMTYVERVQLPRRVRFLLGAGDPLVKIADARDCAAQFPDGDCYIVPGLAHGLHQFGPSFVEHVRYFLRTQLGDWRD